MNKRPLKVAVIKPDLTPIKNASKLFKYKAQDGKQYELNLRQKKFADLYLQYQGRGIDAIIDAGYDVKNKRGEINRHVARNMAAENLAKPAIYNYITNLLTQEGFNSENVDKQHLFLINQHADLSAKSKAIDMYNKLKARYPKDQAQIDLINKYLGKSDDELNSIIEGEVIKDE